MGSKTYVSKVTGSMKHIKPMQTMLRESLRQCNAALIAGKKTCEFMAMVYVAHRLFMCIHATKEEKNTISHPNAQKKGMINVSYYITCASVDCTAITANIQQRITLS